MVAKYFVSVKNQGGHFCFKNFGNKRKGMFGLPSTFTSMGSLGLVRSDSNKRTPPASQKTSVIKFDLLLGQMAVSVRV